MTTAIEKPAPFDPAAAVNAIRDRIRGAMLDIIPTEQWDALIKAEMHAFMNDRVTGSGYNQNTYPSGFKKIVHEMLEEDAKARVKALLSSPEWQAKWTGSGGDTEASDAVKAYVTANAGAILNAWVGNAIQQVVQQMQYRT